MSARIQLLTAAGARSLPWTCRVGTHGEKQGRAIRSLLIESGHSPYNGGANLVNCRGLGTCGTCAVVVSGSGFEPATQNRRERMRFALPPHRGGAPPLPGKGQLRLACQCRVLPGGNVSVQKPAGFWGHKELRKEGVESQQRRMLSTTSASGDAHALHPDDFDYAAIRNLKPFHPWLHGEMRSNQAGETGAVAIYQGARWALGVRQRYRIFMQDYPAQQYEDALQAFVEEHEGSERQHLVALNMFLDEAGDKSIFLPIWRVAGFSLGAASTLWCPRGMYVTTDAVETFVEEHYVAQILRLESELQAAQDGCGSTAGKKELVRLLKWACEDEVHHQQEARDRASDPNGPQVWKGFEWVDKVWRVLVMQGSAAAAAVAKRR